MPDTMSARRRSHKDCFSAVPKHGELQEWSWKEEAWNAPSGEFSLTAECVEADYSNAPYSNVTLYPLVSRVLSTHVCDLEGLLKQHHQHTYNMHGQLGVT